MPRCISAHNLRTLPSPPVRSLGWSATGRLAAGLATGEVVVWDGASGVEKKRWKAHASAVTALGWQPSEDVLVTGSADGLLASWHSDGRAIQEWRQRGPVVALDWQADGREIAVVLGHPARLLAGALDGLEHEFALGGEESAVAWRPGAQEVAVAKAGEPMRVWSPVSTVDSLVTQSFPSGRRVPWLKSTPPVMAC